MPPSAEPYDWRWLGIVAILGFVFWPWALLLVDLCHWIVTGTRLFPNLIEARMGAALLWPIVCMVVGALLAF